VVRQLQITGRQSRCTCERRLVVGSVMVTLCYASIRISYVEKETSSEVRVERFMLNVFFVKYCLVRRQMLQMSLEFRDE